MANIPGTPGDDNLPGTAQDDVITGLEGNDTIAGNGGNDLIYGNQGNDLIDLAAAAAAGNDTIFGGQGTDTVGNQLNPIGTGADVIYGNLGDDFLNGELDNDTIFGGQGNDVVNGDNGNDIIYGNLGEDTLNGGNGTDTLFGGQGNDMVFGFSGNDIIYGNLGNDIVTTQAGNYTIFGGQGNDIIVEFGGPTNSDRMFGNLGADTFDFSEQTPPSGTTQATADHIADFSDAQGDKVRVHGTIYAEIQGDPTVTSVETATTFANAHSMFSGADLVFVAGVSDGYLLVDQFASPGFPNDGDYAIVLDGLNNTSLFGALDVIVPTPI